MELKCKAAELGLAYLTVRKAQFESQRVPVFSLSRKHLLIVMLAWELCSSFVVPKILIDSGELWLNHYEIWSFVAEGTLVAKLF